MKKPPALPYLQAVVARSLEAVRQHGLLQNIYHGIGLIDEEIEEFGHWVRCKEAGRAYDQVWDELVDVGTTCLRLFQYLHPDKPPQELVDRIMANYACSVFVPHVVNLHSAFALLIALRAMLLELSVPPLETNAVGSGTARKMLAEASLSMLNIAAACYVNVVAERLSPTSPESRREFETNPS